MSVVDFSESSEPLPSDAGGLFAVFFEAAGIENENAVFFAVERCGVFGDLVEDDLVLPNGFADESLKGESILSESIDDGLNIFALDVGEETVDIRGRVCSRFGSWEIFEKGLQKVVESSSGSGEIIFVNLRTKIRRSGKINFNW